MFLNKKIDNKFELNILNSQFYYYLDQKYIILKNKNFFIKILDIPIYVFVKKKSNCHIFVNLFQKRFNLDFKNFKGFLLKLINSINKVVRKKLILKGLGLRIYYSRSLKILKLKLGFSHLIFLPIPKTIKIFKKKNFILLESYNSVVLGNFAHLLSQFKFPNSYTGKGIWFKNQFLKLKPVKKN